MSERGMVRVLVAPCGTWVGVECTDDEPGFTRTIREAREDLRLGYTEVRADIHEARARLRACQCHCCETHRYDLANTRHLWSADELDD